MDLKIKGSATYSFLLHVSSHISGHPQCKNVEYIVRIHDGQIDIKPDIKIFNDTHHRKKHNYTSVKDHIFYNHLKNISPINLINGIYQYKFNIHRTQRRWTRLK